MPIAPCFSQDVTVESGHSRKARFQRQPRVTQKSNRKQRAISRARATQRPQPAVRPLPRGNRRTAALLRWLTTSKLLLILGVAVAATILTVMYYRLTRPTVASIPTVPAATGTPSSQYLPTAPILAVQTVRDMSL